MRFFTLLFLSVLISEFTSGQVTRYRLSVNSGIFAGELKSEISHPLRDEISHPGSSDFKPVLKPGAEFEVISPFTSDFEMGLQLGYNQFAGQTTKAPLYNFFLSKNNPLPDIYKYPDKAMIYESKLLTAQATARWYFLPYKKGLNIFLNASGGVAFVGTDFTFEDPFYRVEYDVGVLFARGTNNSDYPKKAAFTGGAGLGATYRLSDKLDIYFDATASVIRSDIVNGVPNFNYTDENGGGKMERTNSFSSVLEASFGLIYSAIPDRRLNKGNYTKSRTSSKKFLNRNRNRPFIKGKRR
jgi:hypothetical protein